MHSSNYIECLNQHLDEFKSEAVQYLTDNHFDPQSIIEYELKVNRTIGFIGSILSSQKMNNHVMATESFEEMMKSLDNPLALLLKSYPKERLKLFRCRTDDKANEDMESLKEFSIFHIPFTKRYLVSNSRFNIHGFPCLYVSDTLRLSLQETVEYNQRESKKSINPNDLNLAKFSNSRHISLFDFSFQDFDRLAKKSKSTLLNYLLIFPLIIAIHTIIDYDKDRPVHFKQEYVLPNLMLIWLINREYNNLNSLKNIGYNFIKYSSVRVDDIENSNYIFYPQVIDDQNEYCKNLKELFLHAQSYIYDSKLIHSSCTFTDIDQNAIELVSMFVSGPDSGIKI